MEQVYVHNLTKEDIVARWNGKPVVLEAGSLTPTERGIADVWMKHHGGDEENPSLAVKELGEVVVAEKAAKLKTDEAESEAKMEKKPATKKKAATKKKTTRKKKTE